MDDRIIAYFRGELSEQERIELLKDARIDSALRKELAAYQNMSALVELAPDAVDITAGKEGLSRLMRKRRIGKTMRAIRLGVGYAAAVALLVTATWMVATSSQAPSESAEIVKQEFFVPPGQRARTTLPDGTVVWLNAGSTLTYPSVFKKERRVTLVGEAYFDVTHQPDKPFIVSTTPFAASTESVEFKVLGTKFNLCCYPRTGYLSAILVEGSIKVYRSKSEASGIVLKPNRQLVYEKGNFSVSPFTDTDKMLWKEGIYAFTKEPFGEIIKKLELYYDVEIAVNDPSILQFQYTGKFRQRDGVVEILRIIQKIHPFKMAKDEQLNKITLSK